MLQPRLVKVEPVQTAKLKLTYETGEKKLFDVASYIKGEWYAALEDDAYFRQVRLLPDGDGIEWPDGQDIAPHELYEESREL